MSHLDSLPTDIRNVLINEHHCYDLLLTNKYWYNTIIKSLRSYHTKPYNINDILLSNCYVLTAAILNSKKFHEILTDTIPSIHNKYILRKMYSYGQYIMLDNPKKRWNDWLSHPKAMKHFVCQIANIEDTQLLSSIIAKDQFYNIIQGLEKSRNLTMELWLLDTYGEQLSVLKPISNLSYRPVHAHENIIRPISVEHLEAILAIGYNFSDGYVDYPSWMLGAVRKDPVALRGLLRWENKRHYGYSRIEVGNSMEFSDECLEVIREERPNTY